MASYYVRWRGEVSGPYEAEVLRHMLAEGQISRFHQVSADQDKWVSVRMIRELQPSGRPPPLPPNAPADDESDDELTRALDDDVAPANEDEDEAETPPELKPARSPLRMADSPAKCPTCGKELAAGAVICVGCGLDLRSGKQLGGGAPAALPNNMRPDRGPSRPRDNPYEMSWFDSQFANMSGCSIVVISFCFAGLALILGIIGLLVCRNEDARAQARLMVTVSGGMIALGFLIGFVGACIEQM